MYTARLSRKEFLDWIGSQRVPALESMQDGGNSDDEVMLVWEKRPTSKNASTPILLVDEHKIESFFAFTSTYVSTYFPLSAFFPVYRARALHTVLDRRELSENKLPNALVAVAIAEAYIQMRGKVANVSDITLSACSATFSASAIQLAFQGGTARELGEMSDNWNDCRSILGGESLALPSQELEAFWSFLIDSFTDGPEFRLRFDGDDERSYRANFLSSITGRGQGDLKSWAELCRNLPKSFEALESMSDSKERRVRSLDEAMAELLSERGTSKATREFVAGYLLSMVGGGSLQYLNLVEPFREALPAAVLWFGVFCGLSSKTDAMTIGGCLGRRLARDLLRTPTLFEAGRYDISADELRVVRPEEKVNQAFRSAHASSVVVEVHPGVVASFRTGRRADAAVSNRAMAERDQEIRFLLDRVYRLLEGPENARKQSELFEDRPIKRYRR